MDGIFEIIKISSDSKARVGILRVNGIEIPTPAFMPVGTQGTIKAMMPRLLEEVGYKLILGNTYHLYLRPGIDVLEMFGGLHKFMNWNYAILTDSGGFQVFSLKQLRKIDDDGVEFRSHIDGSKHFFTPEKVIEIQKIIGSDIVMVLDECSPFPISFDEAKKSMELSMKWARRSKNHFNSVESRWKRRQYLFGIVQGSLYPALRIQSIQKLLEIGFDGYAIGGLAVGEPVEKMYEITNLCTEYLGVNYPRYLMGVGTPENILTSIELGVDMFDCVLPTRNARNGQIFTTRGKINIRNSKYKYSKEFIDPGLDNYVSKNFTLGYLRHLFVAKELLAYELATFQNLAFYYWLFSTARVKILQDNFRQWKNEVILYFREIVDF